MCSSICVSIVSGLRPGTRDMFLVYRVSYLTKLSFPLSAAFVEPDVKGDLAEDYGALMPGWHCLAGHRAGASEMPEAQMA